MVVMAVVVAAVLPIIGKPQLKGQDHRTRGEESKCRGQKSRWSK